MAVEPCWHKWIIGGHRREYEHFDAAYSGGFALGQLRPKPRSEPIGCRAPIPDDRGVPTKVQVDQTGPSRGRAECQDSPARQMSLVTVFETKPNFSGCRDDVFKRLATYKAVDVSGNIARAPLNGSIGPWRAVRRHDHVRQFMERVVGGARRRIASARIPPPGVQRRSADDPSRKAR